MASDYFTLQTADWSCPVIERAAHLACWDARLLAALADSESVKEMAKNFKKSAKVGYYTLPVWQNLEAAVHGLRIAGEGWKPSSYCVSHLKELADFSFSIADSPLIQAQLRVIEMLRKEPVILEVEAPFSVLAALVNPIELYACGEKERGLLAEILHEIAAAQADYVKLAARAGCRIFSAADPAGTMDLVGEQYYREICGRSEWEFLSLCEGQLTDSVMHLCKKMSQSLVLSGMAQAEERILPGEKSDLACALWELAENPAVHFTGMKCLHAKNAKLKKIDVMHLR